GRFALSMQLHLIEGPVSNLDAYASIPISFVIKSRFNLDQLWLGVFSYIPFEAGTKDYDSLESIITLPSRFDVSNWAMLIATRPSEFVPISLPKGVPLSGPDLHPIGGAILAWNSPDVDMLEGGRILRSFGTFECIRFFATRV